MASNFYINSFMGHSGNIHLTVNYRNIYRNIYGQYQVAHVGHSWGLTMLLTELPSYMKGILHYDLKAVSWFSFSTIFFKFYKIGIMQLKGFMGLEWPNVCATLSRNVALLDWFQPHCGQFKKKPNFIHDSYPQSFYFNW